MLAKLYRLSVIAVLLILGFVTVKALTTATVTTDMPDYYPGDTVTISGSGWEPGETVNLTITQVDPPTGDEPTNLSAVADALGFITNSEFRVLENHLGASFTLVAQGVASGRTAHATFTDSPLLTTITISAQSPNPVAAGNQTSYSIEINRAAGARNFDVNLSVTGLPAGVTPQFSPPSVNFGGGTNSRTVSLTLAVGGSVPTGTYPFTVRAQVATNSADFATVAGSLVVLNDAIAPTTQESYAAPNANGWHKTNVAIALSATDNVGGTGVKRIVYSATGAQTIGSTSVNGPATNLTISVEGTTTVSFFAEDNAGNIESTKTVVIKLDKTAPTVTQGATSGTAGTNGWYRSDVSVAFTATDATSGLADPLDASFSQGTISEGSSVALPVRTVVDKAGNSANSAALSFKVDKTAPVLTQGALTGTPGNDGWYRSDVSVAFTAADATSGLAAAGDESFSLSASGEGSNVTTNSREVLDQAGNSSMAGPLSFKIDKTAPSLTEGATTGTEGMNGWYWSNVSVAWSAQDAVSGLKVPAESSFALTTNGEGPGISTGSRVIEDVAGNSATADARSFDVDLNDPAITAEPDRDPNGNGWYTAPVTFTFSGSDEGSGIATISPPESYSGPDSDVATVGATATDNSGRTSNQSFSLKYDSTKPSVIVNGIDASCLREASITTEASDLFLSTHTMTLNDTPYPVDQTLDVFAEGEYTLVVRATDQAGNETVVTKEFTIDLSAPEILFGAAWPEENRYYNTDRLLEFSLANPDDTFTKRSLTRSLSDSNLLITLISGYSEVEEGRFVIEIDAEDCAGNTTSVTRTFFVDKTAPVASIQAIGTEGANGWYVGDSLAASLSALDPKIREASVDLDEILGSGLSLLTYSSSGATPIGEAQENTAAKQLELQEGISTIQVRASDVAGNESSMVSLEFKYDKTAPELDAISDLTREATGPDGAAVDLPEANATDNLSDVQIAYSHASGSTFPLGETTVTVTATDEAGNSSQITFKVKVEDTTPPNLQNVPANMTVEATGPDGAPASFSLPDAVDLVDPNPTVESSHNPGSTFAIGETTVTFTAKDAAGNQSTASFTVKVVDTTPPTLTLPANMTVEGNTLGGATVTFSPTASDIVDGVVAVATTPTSGSLFAKGTTTVLCEAEDSRGNKATGSFTVTVVDTTPPTFSDVPGAIIAEASGPSGASVMFTPPTADDIVDGPVSVDSSHPSGATFPLGTTTVTFTSKDAEGNTVTATLDIAVRDTTAPTLTLPANIHFTATSALGAVANFSASATDIVSGNVPVMFSQNPGTVFSLGETTVVCTATDGAGNVATGSFKVFVTYAWSGVLQPVKPDGSGVHKLGSTIPIKFQLTGASAGISDATARLYLTKISDAVVGDEVEAVSTAASTTGNLFRYTDGQYIFNLSTKGLSVGRWRVRIDLGDGVSRTVELSLK